MVGVAAFLQAKLGGRGNWGFSSSLLVQAAKGHSQGPLLLLQSGRENCLEVLALSSAFTMSACGHCTP